MIEIIALILVIVSLYLGESGVTVGGFGIPYKYLLEMGVVALAFLEFMVYPNLEKGKKVFGFFMVFSAPMLISILYSMFIWIFNFSGLRFMTRGLFYPVYNMIGFLAAAALVYIFEKRAVWIMALSITGICIYRIIMGILTVGFAEWSAEWILLMQTVGIEVGPTLSAYEEFNEALFGLGLMLLYFIIMFIAFREYRRKFYLWILFLLGMFAFVTGFKRIALGGIAAGVIFFLIGLPMSDERRKKYAVRIGIGMIIFSIGYLLISSSDLFVAITDSLGIDTKGRDVIYQDVNEWYSFSPVFLGQGLGYVSRTMATLAESMRELLGDSVYTAGEIHNDILRNYIELGFYAFPVWLYLMTVFRIRYFTKNYGGKAGVVVVLSLTYMFITYTTDNTYYYNLPNLAFALLPMTYAFQEETS